MPVKIADVIRALEHDEIVPAFQPVIDLRSGRLAGFEILARWQSPTRGLVLPRNFISIAEENGLIGNLTHQVLRKAFRCVSMLPAPLSLAINISPIQMHYASLPRQIRDAAEEAGFPLNRLTVEITESALLCDLPRVQKVARALKDLGCRLSIDDFGTGFSSLGHLQALPFNDIKIDRGFVGNMTISRESRKIVAAIVGLGHSLGLTTVAEGVETEEQAEILQWLGCEHGQGWLYGRPTTADTIPGIVAAPARAVSLQSSKQNEGLAVSSMEALSQLQAIYDSSPVGMCFLDRNLSHITINRQLAEMTDVSVAACKGKTVKESVPSFLYPKIEPHLLRALKGEAVMNVEVTRKVDTPEKSRTTLASYLPVRDEANEVIGISVAVVDISPRKRAEDALRARNEEYRFMVELHPQASWTMDANGANLEVNPPAAQIAGFSEDWLRNLGWFEASHPADRETAMKTLEQALHAGTSIDLQYRVRNVEGEWRWMRSRGEPRFDLSGKIQSWYGCIEDIDDHKRLEEALSESQRQTQFLFQAIRNRIRPSMMIKSLLAPAT
jgi:PAS domain S-box-containing protein